MAGWEGAEAISELHRFVAPGRWGDRVGDHLK